MKNLSCIRVLCMRSLYIDSLNLFVGVLKFNKKLRNFLSFLVDSKVLPNVLFRVCRRYYEIYWALLLPISIIYQIPHVTLQCLCARERKRLHSFRKDLEFGSPSFRFTYNEKNNLKIASLKLFSVQKSKKKVI